MIVRTYLPYYCRTRPTSCRPKPFLTDKPTIPAKRFCVTLTAYFMYVNLNLNLYKRTQHCWMLHVASVCTHSCMLVGVVAQSLKPVKLQRQQLPTFLSFRDCRSSCPFRKRSMPFVRHLDNVRPVIESVSIKKIEDRNPEWNPDLEPGPFIFCSLPCNYTTTKIQSKTFNVNSTWASTSFSLSSRPHVSGCFFFWKTKFGLRSTSIR